MTSFAHKIKAGVKNLTPNEFKKALKEASESPILQEGANTAIRVLLYVTQSVPVVSAAAILLK
jgi:hypothetical protein